MPLTDRQVRQAHQPCVLVDGNGLRFRVSTTRGGGLSKKWLLRYTLPDGRQREAGLGAYPQVSLAEARAKAAELRQKTRQGVDPLAEREAAKRARAAEAARAMTFRQCAETYVNAHEASWKNAKHRQQWTQTLIKYVYPVFGDVTVADVD